MRLLLHPSEIEIEGLVATTSTHRKAMVAPDSIRRVLGSYAAVRDEHARANAPHDARHEK